MLSRVAAGVAAVVTAVGLASSGGSGDSILVPANVRPTTRGFEASGSTTFPTRYLIAPFRISGRKDSGPERLPAKAFNTSLDSFGIDSLTSLFQPPALPEFQLFPSSHTNGAKAPLGDLGLLLGEALSDPKECQDKGFRINPNALRESLPAACTLAKAQAGKTGNPVTILGFQGSNPSQDSRATFTAIGKPVLARLGKWAQTKGYATGNGARSLMQAATLKAIANQGMSPPEFADRVSMSIGKPFPINRLGELPTAALYVDPSLEQRVVDSALTLFRLTSDNRQFNSIPSEIRKELLQLKLATAREITGRPSLTLPEALTLLSSPTLKDGAKSTPDKRAQLVPIVIYKPNPSSGGGSTRLGGGGGTTPGLPDPLSILGVAAAFRASRKLKDRIAAAEQMGIKPRTNKPHRMFRLG